MARGGGGGHGGGFVMVGGYGGGVARPEDPSVGDYSQIHTVAVLSAIGQSVQLVKPGDSNQVTVHTTDWMLDEYINTELGRLLSARFDVKAANYDPRQLCTVPPGTDPLTAYLATVPNPGVDAYVVVRSNAAFRFDRNPGLEVLSAGNGMPPQESLGFDILIIDAHTLKTIGKSFARVQLRSGAPADFANFLAPMDRDPGPSLSPSEAQMELYHRDFKLHVGVVVIHTMRSLALGLPLPEAGKEPLVPMTAEEKPGPQIKSVAVVSAVGDSFTFGYRAAFSDHHVASIPIPDWKLDDKIETLIKARLDKRFAVKDVSVYRDVLAKTNALAPNAFIPFGILPQSLPGLSPRTDIDAYILVLKRSGAVGFTDSVSGVGVWKRKPLFASDETALFANYEIVVVDAHTLTVLSHKSGVTGVQNWNPIPYRRIDGAVWPSGDVNALDPGQVPAVQQTLSEVLTDSLDETLLDLGLTGMKRQSGFDLIPASVPMGSSAPVVASH